VSCHIPCHRVFVSHFTRFSDSRHNSGPTVCISHFFLRFSLFLPYFMSYTVCFSFCSFFSVSRHIPGTTMWVSQFFVSQFSLHIHISTVCISHFSCFSVFLDIFQVMQCLCFIFHVFLFSRYTPDLTVCISHFSCFSLFLAIFHVIQCLWPIFPRFSVFSPYSRSYSVYFSFFMFFTVPCHIPGHTVFMSHFPRFSVFST